MKWIRNLLLVYAGLTVVSLGVMLGSTLSFDPNVATPFEFSETANEYAKTRQWPDRMDPVLVEFAASRSWEWLAEGAAGVYTQPSKNPYLFERDWSIRPEITLHPDLVVQTHLMTSSSGALHWVVWFEMPFEEANEALGHNFLHLGYSDEYVVDDVLFQTFYRTKDQTMTFASDANYEAVEKVFQLPTVKTAVRFHDVNVVGFLVLTITDPGDWHWFESSVNLYDGTPKKVQDKIVIGFNAIRPNNDNVYEVSATWLRYRKELS